MKIIYQNVVADASVETSNDEGVDFAESLDSGDSRFGNGGDAVIVKLDAIEGAYQFNAMFQTLEAGQMLQNILVADVKLFDSKNSRHDVVVVVPSRQIVVAVQVIFA